MVIDGAVGVAPGPAGAVASARRVRHVDPDVTGEGAEGPSPSGRADMGVGPRLDGRTRSQKLPSAVAARRAGAARAGEPLGPLWSRLTDRDRQLLALLSEQRVLTTDQVAGMLFGSRTRAQHRLVELFRLRVLWRFRFPRVAGGSQPWHYTLGYTGARLIAARKGVRPPRPGEHAERLERLAESPRLGHLLGVNDFFTSLAAYARRAGWPDPNVYGGSGLDAWRSEAEITRLHHGDLRPDGFGCWAQAGRLLAFYLEYDTGTEPLARVAAKLDDYSAAHARQNPPLFGMLLFSVASARREANLRTALAHKRCPAPIATTARDLAHPDGPASPVWSLLDRNGSGRGRVTLGHLPGLIGGTSAIGKPLVLTPQPPGQAMERDQVATTGPLGSRFDMFDDDPVQLIELGDDL